MPTTTRVLFLPARVGARTTTLGVKTGYRAGRRLGPRRVLGLAAGVSLGLVVASLFEPDTRAKLLAQLPGLPGRRADLAERVRQELSHAPRTWHLPQPEVEVVGRRAILRGEVPHEGGRIDLERAAAAVPGVDDVDNLLAVSTGRGTSDTR